MATMARHRRVLYWSGVALLTVLIGAVLVDRASAAGPPGGLDVNEQNLDGSGYIAVHEQGVADVNVTNASLDVAVEFPALQDVNVTNGSLAVDDGAGALSVDDNGGSLTVDGEVTVTNLPTSAASFFGNTGLLQINDLTDPIQRTTPDGTITDIVVSIGSNGSPRCYFEISSGDRTDFANRLFSKTVLDQDTILINLTNGWPGPLTLYFANNTSSASTCSFQVTYTGFSNS